MTTNKNLTATQTAALRKIAENKGRVLVGCNATGIKFAFGEGSEYTSIHGDTARRLEGRRLIKRVDTGITHPRQDNRPVEVWELTDAGRDAIGLPATAPTQPAPVAKGYPGPRPFRVRRTRRSNTDAADYPALRGLLDL